MPNGYGRGLGRGGLPRCGYFLSGAAGMPGWPIYGYSPYYAAPPGPFHTGPYPGAGFYAPQMTREGVSMGTGQPTQATSPEQEIEILKSHAQMMARQLNEIQRRIADLGKGR